MAEIVIEADKIPPDLIEYFEPVRDWKPDVWTVATQPFPGSHFATFAPKLIEPCILAGTSERGACKNCGKPWERVVEKTGNKIQCHWAPGTDRKTEIAKGTHGKTSTLITGFKQESKTIGWQPGCKCYGTEPLPEYPQIDKDEIDEYKELFEIQQVNPVRFRRQTMLKSWEPLLTQPCVVMDIFGGAMTTAIVAHKHGRKFVMTELSKTYIDEIGIPRIEQETRQLKLWR
ncbi:MAG: hypothetical protein H8E17_21060 [Deltaproteobacteria bacterium]|nr:hypothetical protein [Deltaproteobacteria bacterium]